MMGRWASFATSPDSMSWAPFKSCAEEEEDTPGAEDKDKDEDDDEEEGALAAADAAGMSFGSMTASCQSPSSPSPSSPSAFRLLEPGIGVNGLLSSW